MLVKYVQRAQKTLNDYRRIQQIQNKIFKEVLQKCIPKTILINKEFSINKRK